MTIKQSTKPRRPSGAATGVKALITTASIAATIGGWAAFSASDNSDQTVTTTSAQVANVSSVSDVAPSVATSQPTVVLAATPTAVPTQIIVSLAQPTVSASTSSDQTQPPATTFVQATDTPAPQPTATDVPQLTATPVTVKATTSTSITRTRSSR